MLMTYRTTTLHLATFAVSLLILSGCGRDAADGVEEPATMTEGQALYELPHDDGNTFACATCHALNEPADDGITRPGHPIGDAAARTTFKNGQLDNLLDAVNTCRQDWLGAPAFTEDDARWLALEGFLKDQAEGAAPSELSFIVADPPAQVDGGDPATGEATFNRTCVVCHGQSGVGTDLAPPIAGTPENADFIAAKIRRSGNQASSLYPELIPGRMPFWAPDRLSDDELRDIVAFLVQSEPPTEVMVTGDEVDLSVADAQSDCGSSHSAVGQSLTFVGNAHAVAGTATIVDDCTIRLSDFSFDGGGIDVHVYGGHGGDYATGPDLSVNMVGTAFDGGEALVRLPEGVTLDDFDGLSIWCVPVGFSFGDGQFQ
jgi:mono/diheme cytochrome c family protein